MHTSDTSINHARPVGGHNRPGQDQARLSQEKPHVDMVLAGRTASTQLDLAGGADSGWEECGYRKASVH